MDRICNLLRELAHWVAATPAPPVIFASLHQGQSRNRPSPYLGLTYQAEQSCPWWEIGDQRHPFPGGSMMVLLAHRGSQSAPMRPLGDVGLWVCTFDIGGSDRFADFVADYRFETRPVRQPSRLIPAYRRVAAAYLRRGPQRGMHLQGAVLSLIATYLDDLTGVEITAAEDQMAPVYDCIHERYRDPDLGLADLAAAAGWSTDHFGRVFRQTTGSTPMAQVHALRLRQAQALLRASDLRVSEVARQVGYRDPLHFSRRFRAATGLSPRAWRRAAAGAASAP